MTRKIVVGLLSAVIAVAAVGLYLYFTDDYLKQQTLADGTEIFYFRGSSFDAADNFPAKRLLERIDGDFFIRSSTTDQPLMLHTQLLKITATGDSAFRVTAHADKTGERVDVLYGHVRTDKRYESPIQETVDMVGGQMMMINVTIDFVEKEVLKDDEVPEWIMQIEPKGIQRP